MSQLNPSGLWTPSSIPLESAGVEIFDDLDDARREQASLVRPRLNPSAILKLKVAWFKCVGFRPFASQWEIHRSAERFGIAVCGRGWGKSVFGAREVEAYAQLRGYDGKGTRCWIVAPTYSLGEKVFREIWQELVIRQRGAELSPRGASESNLTLRMRWGSVIEVKSADHPNSLVGEGVDFLLVDEAAKLSKRVWEQYLRGTLARKKRFGIARFITTPEGFNWVYDVWNRGQIGAVGHRAGWRSWQFPSWTSPYVTAEEIEEAKATLSEETFRQEFGAEFTTFAGRVYKDFSRYEHVYPNPTNPNEEIPDYRNPSLIAEGRYQGVYFCGLDFGVQNPNVCLFGFLHTGGDLDGTLDIYDEVYESGLSPTEFAGRIKQREQGFREATYRYADPSGASERMELAKNGLPTFPADHRGKEGREAVIGRLKEVKGKLRVSARCSNLIREMELYRYPERKTEGSASSEEPLKVDDHTCDSLRYLVMGLSSYRGAGYRGSRVAGV